MKDVSDQNPHCLIKLTALLDTLTQVAALTSGSDSNHSPIPVAEIEIRLIGGELVYDIYRK